MTTVIVTLGNCDTFFMRVLSAIFFHFIGWLILFRGPQKIPPGLCNVTEDSDNDITPTPYSRNLDSDDGTCSGFEGD